MFDINFFKNTLGIKDKIVNGEMSNLSSEDIFLELESFRSKEPVLFNFETTNNCNMRCIMCPRTTLMDRRITYISDDNFDMVLDQIKPHKKEALSEFWDLIRDEYEIDEEERSENSFYFYVVSRCVILHGFGEPIIDPSIVKRVQSCTDRDIPTYFSCVPANIRMERVIALMEAGLDVLKFAVDALDDETQKSIRGKRNNFTQAFKAILEVLEYKKKHPEIKTKIVLTLIALSQTEQHAGLHQEFMELWENYPVYAYIKTQDNRWYFKKEEDYKPRSHYELQYCEFPWTSLTVMSNGVVVPCTQDYNTEIHLGNIHEESLKDIWNGEKYEEFRKAHISGDFSKCASAKCRDRCDLPKMYQKLHPQKKMEDSHTEVLLT